MKSFIKIKWISLCSIIGFIAVTSIYSCDSFEKKVDFNTEVRPILNKNCITCHGGVKKAGDFSLLFREEALGNTKSGKPAIIPGDPEHSEFITRLSHKDAELRMPYLKPSLSDNEIKILKKWIKQGAEWQDHWSFVKPKSVSPPALSDPWIKNDVDKFILDKLNKEGLKPNAEADKITLIRRVSLDLTGLPPSPEQVNKFVKDNSPQAYEKLVDELLKSPHYGERWTSLWMDLARYADTKGYEKDLGRTMWPYRDWLIKAFNKDMPYDQFTIEQLAGDLLPRPTTDQMVATAFHRNTMTNDEGGTDDEEFRTAAVVDRVNTTFDVWQGITIGCVQCHSHPYDPIRHEEYYKFMAFLNNTQDRDLSGDAPLVPCNFSEVQKNEIEQMLVSSNMDLKSFKGEDFLSARRKLLMPRLEAEDCDDYNGLSKEGFVANYVSEGSHIKFNKINMSDFDGMHIKYSTENGKGIFELRIDSINGPVIGRMDLPHTQGWGKPKERSAKIRPVQGEHDIYIVFRNDPYRIGICNFDWIEFTGKNILPSEKESKNLQELKRKILSIRKPDIPVMKDFGSDTSRKTFVFERGNWMVKGKEVKPEVPKSFNPFPEGAPANRLGMARWLASKENPLTARVAVNRFWEQLFGFGIVETLEDFGSQGFKPTHPELLDWLAVRFMNEQKWSMKKLLKELVMSATYRQSSEISAEKLEKDSRNVYLARAPRVRLTAEQIRDQALAVSGILSPRIFGPSVMPYQPDGVWQTVYNSDPNFRWKASEGQNRYRRGLYTYWRRTSPYPSMITFDNTSREICTVRRIRTNTPLQALVTLNDTVYIEAAKALAEKSVDKKSNMKDWVNKAYSMALFKSPTPATSKVLCNLYTKAKLFYQKKPQAVPAMTGGEKSAEVAAMTVVANAILNLDEFITKN